MWRRIFLLVGSLGALLALGGCATRPVNPPIAQADPNTGYRFATRQHQFKDPETLVILAFSGGGMRAAAGTIIRNSPEFQRLLKEGGATIVTPPVSKP